jgi:hypothetical protein
MKEWAIAHDDKVVHICTDDKSTIPVTDLGVYCGAVPRQRRVITARDVTPSVGGHDFVQFQVDIEPGTQYDDVSFYRGTPTVIFKNQLFEPSSATRHAVEELNTIEMLENSVKEIMVMYTDGGPDHRKTFITVILADMAQWLVDDFDILVHFRTPAGLSIRNPAERLMSVPNMSLYGVVCSRHKLSEENEEILNPLATKSKIRDAEGDTVKKLIEETA